MPPIDGRTDGRCTNPNVLRFVSVCVAFRVVIDPKIKWQVVLLCARCVRCVNMTAKYRFGQFVASIYVWRMACIRRHTRVHCTFTSMFQVASMHSWSTWLRYKHTNTHFTKGTLKIEEERIPSSLFFVFSSFRKHSRCQHYWGQCFSAGTYTPYLLLNVDSKASLNADQIPDLGGRSLPVGYRWTFFAKTYQS